MPPLPRRLLALLLAAACSAGKAGPGVVFEGRSEINERIVVVDDDQGVRSLHFALGSAVQSAVRPGRPLELQLPYTQAAMVALALVPKPSRILVIGVGGGAMPRFLRQVYPAAAIDGVDVDPVVLEVARRFFELREDRKLRTIVADGRRFVEQARGGYDLIFLDAYGDSEIPRHLATLEFLRAARSRLAPGGLLAANVWGQRSNPLHDAMRATYQAAFPRFCEMDVPGTANRIFLAADGEGPLEVREHAEAAGRLSRARKLPFDLSEFASRGCLPEPLPRAEPLTDATAADP